MLAETASSRWTQLDGQRTGLLDRCERYAKLTVRRAFLEGAGDHQSAEDQRHDVQAVGAQAVNHLANKLMLALFAPSRPFFRLSPAAQLVQDATAAGLDEAKLSEVLALAEKEAVREMDRRSMRPQCYNACRQLIVTGNTLLDFSDKQKMRAIGLRYYVVKRNIRGTVQEIMIREPVTFAELEDAVQDELKAVSKREYKDDEKVVHYKWIKLDGKKYRLTQHVDEYKLGSAFDGAWPEQQLPYRVLAWDLADDADYGVGHVEDYAADISALSALSQAVVAGAIMASEFRWAINPTGMTSVEDFKRTPNGGVYPGMRDDVSIVNAQTGTGVQQADAVAQTYVQRIGRGFLMNSAVTRNAERVTAEEIRIQAMELETALGGAYTRLAVDYQLPLARFLLEAVDMKIAGNDIEPMIVTGLDALSRNGDLDNLKLWLADMAALQSLGDQVLQRLKIGPIAAALAAARGIQTSTYLVSEEEMQQAQQAAAAQQAAMQAPPEQGTP